MSIQVANEILSVTTVEEFDEIVKSMKKSHPLKYAARVASGDLDKQRSQLIQPVAKEVPEVKVEVVKEESEVKTKKQLIEEVVAKGIQLSGTESKADLLELLK